MNHCGDFFVANETKVVDSWLWILTTLFTQSAVSLFESFQQRQEELVCFRSNASNLGKLIHCMMYLSKPKWTQKQTSRSMVMRSSKPPEVWWSRYCVVAIAIFLLYIYNYNIYLETPSVVCPYIIFDLIFIYVSCIYLSKLNACLHYQNLYEAHHLEWSWVSYSDNTDVLLSNLSNPEICLANTTVLPKKKLNRYGIIVNIFTYTYYSI